jgi:hypothetical protein
MECRRASSTWLDLFAGFQGINLIYCSGYGNGMRVLDILADYYQVDKIYRGIVKNSHTPPGLLYVSLSRDPLYLWCKDMNLKIAERLGLTCQPYPRMRELPIPVRPAYRVQKSPACLNMGDLSPTLP